MIAFNRGPLRYEKKREEYILETFPNRWETYENFNHANRFVADLQRFNLFERFKEDIAESKMDAQANCKNHGIIVQNCHSMLTTIYKYKDAHQEVVLSEIFLAASLYTFVNAPPLPFVPPNFLFDKHRPDLINCLSAPMQGTVMYKKPDDAVEPKLKRRFRVGPK